MYQDYYGFTADPFRLASKGDSLYLHDSFKRAMSYLLYAFHKGEGVVLLTGGAGLGKTTLLSEVVSEATDVDTAIAVVDCANLAGGDLLEMYLEVLGVEAASGSTVSRAVRETLGNIKVTKQPILVLDNAHLLDEQNMDRVHMLCNLNQQGTPLVQVVMAGQPLLRETLLTPAYEQLHQRLIATCNIEPLQMVETREYVLHKLRAVNWTNNPSFAESVFGAIYRSSLGVPRWIDLICSRMLLNAMASDKKYISLDDVCEVISDLVKEDLLPNQVRQSTPKVA